MRCAACRVPISAIEGSFVTTIEGLSRDRSHPVQQAFAANMVPQCGYCIPGMIMAAAALVDRNDSVDRRADRRRDPQLCRCGIYPRLREAIRRAIRIKNGRERVGARAAAGVSPEEAARAVPALRAPPPAPPTAGADGR